MITLSSTLLVAALALLAGALTTVAGMGGGLLLIVALSALWDPRFALAVTGPALLLGNIHRFWLYRADLDRRAALRYLAGGVPGALVGGWALLAAPPALLRGGMVVLAAMALLRSLGGGRFGLPQAALVPGGFATGFVTSTSGGGGLLAGPMLIATGLKGRAYIATAAAGAAAIHLTRIVTYGAGHLLTGQALGYGLVAAAAMPAGNLLGNQLRSRVTDENAARIELGTVSVAALLAALDLTA